MALRAIVLTIAVVTVASTAAAQVPAASVAKPSPSALYEQARQYDLSKNGGQDSGKATVLFRQAADLGSGEAMFSLGVSYWAGRGVSEDLIEAYKWLDLAATYASNREKDTAVQARNALARVLTPSQIEDAKKRAQAWQIGFENRK